MLLLLLLLAVGVLQRGVRYGASEFEGLVGALLPTFRCPRVSTQRCPVHM